MDGPLAGTERSAIPVTTKRPVVALIAGIVGIGVLLGAAYLLLVYHGPDYGYPADMRAEYGITQYVAETRSQPRYRSLFDVSDYIERHGVPCPIYEEFRQEPSPDGGDFSGETHVWAECTGGRLGMPLGLRLVIYTYSSHGSKVAHEEDALSCWARPTKQPSYWLEGPTWRVVIDAPRGTDAAALSAEVQRMARLTGARAYRACGPGVG